MSISIFVGMPMFKNRNPEAYRKLCQILIEVRMAKPFTQAELAQRIGVSQQFISKYETGERRLDVIEFLEVTKALRTDPHRILKNIAD